MFDYFGNQFNVSAFQWRTYKYFADVTLLASQVLANQSIILRGEEAYFAIMRLMSTQTGSFRFSLYTSTSDRYQAGTISATTDRVRSECYFGTAQRPAVLPIPIIIPGSSNIMFDVEDVSVAGNTLHLVFEGARAYPK